MNCKLPFPRIMMLQSDARRADRAQGLLCHRVSKNQGPDFDDMSSFFPCEIDDAIQYINFGYGAQAPKIVIL